MNSIGQILGARGTYSQKLSTPAWKSFAAGVRQSKGMACESCKQGGKPLQVHHLFYDPDREPWDYQIDEVVLLCSTCHEQLHGELARFRRYVFRKLTPAAFRVVNGALAAGLDAHDPLKFAYAVASMAASPGSVERFAADWKPAQQKAENPTP